MRTLACALLAVTPGLFAQHAEHKTSGAKQEPRDVPPHRADARLTPHAALVHLQASRVRVVNARGAEHESKEHGAAARESAKRPSGAGRTLAAMLVCADARLDVPGLFGQAKDDLLVMSSPGPFARLEEIAALERAVRDDGLALAVIVVHEGCATLAPRPAATPTKLGEPGQVERTEREPDPATRALGERVARARELARAEGVPLARAHARQQVEQIFAASPFLAERRARGELEVAIAIADAKGEQVTWIAPWLAEPPKQAGPGPRR